MQTDGRSGRRAAGVMHEATRRRGDSTPGILRMPPATPHGRESRLDFLEMGSEVDSNFKCDTLPRCMRVIPLLTDLARLSERAFAAFEAISWRPPDCRI